MLSPSPWPYHTHASKGLRDVGHVHINDRQYIILLFETCVLSLLMYSYPAFWYVMTPMLTKRPTMPCGRLKWLASTRPLLPSPRFVAIIMPSSSFLINIQPLQYKIEVVWFYGVSDVLDQLSNKKGDSKSTKAKKIELRNKMWAHLLVSIISHSKQIYQQPRTLSSPRTYLVNSQASPRSCLHHWYALIHTPLTAIHPFTISSGNRYPSLQAGMSKATCAWWLLFLSVCLYLYHIEFYLECLTYPCQSTTYTPSSMQLSVNIQVKYHSIQWLPD